MTGEITIRIGKEITPIFTQVNPICTGATLTTLPTTSNNGITGTWSPVLNNMATTTYTFSPNSGQCATTAMMTIVVGAPTLTITASSTSICVGQSVTLTPSGANTYALYPGNISSNGTPFIVMPTHTTTYTIVGNTSDCCKGTTQITIVVKDCDENEGCSTPLFNPISLCYGDRSFSLPTTSLNGITGTWSPALSNTNSGIYTFKPNNTRCPEVNINITVFPKTSAYLTFDALSNGLASHYYITNAIGSSITNYTWYYYPNRYPINGVVIASGPSVSSIDTVNIPTIGQAVSNEHIWVVLTDSNGCSIQFKSLYE
jgi:hypothetical protein